MHDSAWDRALTHVVRAAEDAPSAGVLLDRVGAGLADAVDADAHVFLRLDPLTALWLDATGAGYDPAACEHFTSHVFLRSEVADYAAAARASSAVIRVNRDTLSPGDAYAAYYLDDLGFEEDLHATFGLGGQAFGHLTLGRRHGRFSAAEQRLVARAVPAVTAALRRLLARDTLASIPGDGVGLLRVGADGTVVAMNDHGDGLLQRARLRDPRFTRTALSAVVELARRDLHHPDPTALPPVVYVEAETGRRYRLLAERMRVPAGEVAAALVVAEPIRALDSVELLRTVGLTDREAEVALLQLRGFRSAEGAAALGVTEHTFLAHLKSVYRKVGVRSRGELAAFMLSGA